MRLLCTILAFMSFLAFPGCSDDKKKGPDPEPDPYMKQTSITNCLYNLKLSYNQQNVAKYRSLIDLEYTYIFDPRDVGMHGIPESWFYVDEVASAAALFDSLPNLDGYVCESISLNFTTGPETESEVDTTWTEVKLTQIQLLVDCRHRVNHDPLEYQVIGDQATLAFHETDETDPASGLKIWKIIYWVDQPTGGLKATTEPTTWGRIKANWR